METELVALASSGATTIVALMATDSWQEAKAIVVNLWRKALPGSEYEVESRLDTARAAINGAVEARADTISRQLEVDWTQLISTMLRNDPRNQDDLKQVLKEQLEPALTAIRSRTSSTAMSATAHGNSRIYQAGRDQHITEK